MTAKTNTTAPEVVVTTNTPEAPAPEVKTVAPGAETPATQSNDKRFADVLKQVSKLGEEAGLGKDSLPKLANAVVRAAADGAIDLTTKYKCKDKEGDVAQYLYERYAASEGKKAIHEHSAAGAKANVSKLRQLISCGLLTTVDAVELMDRAYQARENMIKDSIKVKSAYPFYVDVAREQLNTDKPLSDRELEAIAMKDEPNPKTLEGELKRALKILEGLITGENRDKVKDSHELVEAAHNSIKERIDGLAKIAMRRELLAKAAAMGIDLA